MDKFKCMPAKSREGITDSLLLSRGDLIASGEKDGLRCEIVVNGDVRIFWEESIYKDVSQFPKELIDVIRAGTIDNDSRASVDMNNWYECFIYKNNKNVHYDVIDIDISTMSDKDLENTLTGCIDEYLMLT